MIKSFIRSSGMSAFTHNVTRTVIFIEYYYYYSGDRW